MSVAKQKMDFGVSFRINNKKHTNISAPVFLKKAKVELMRPCHRNM